MLQEDGGLARVCALLSSPMVSSLLLALLLKAIDSLVIHPPAMRAFLAPLKRVDTDPDAEAETESGYQRVVRLLTESGRCGRQVVAQARGVLQKARLHQAAVRLGQVLDSVLSDGPARGAQELPSYLPCATLTEEIERTLAEAARTRGVSQKLPRARDAAPGARELEASLVRQADALRVPQLLVMCLAAPDLRLSAEFPRIFAAVRGLLLELLRTRGGLLLLAGRPDAVRLLLAVLQDGEEAEKESLLNVLPDLATCLAHPALCTPLHLAYLLAWHLAALQELDRLAAAQEPAEQVACLRNLCGLCVRELTRSALVHVLLLCGGPELLLHLLRRPPERAPDLVPLQAQYCLSLLHAVFQSDECVQCGAALRLAPELQTVLQGLLADTTPLDLRTRAQALQEWLTAAAAWHEGGPAAVLAPLRALQSAPAAAAPLPLVPLTAAVRLLSWTLGWDRSAPARLFGEDLLGLMPPLLRAVAQALRARPDRALLLLLVPSLELIRALVSRLVAALPAYHNSPLADALIEVRRLLLSFLTDESD